MFDVHFYYEVGQFILRIIHVIAGFLWIMQTWTFNRFERQLETPRESLGDHAKSEAWMVHGGGFFRLIKYRFFTPMPPRLHWFMWESVAAWFSGFLYLIIMYYRGGLLVNQDGPISEQMGIVVGLGTLFMSVVIYWIIWASPLCKHEWLGGLVSFLCAVGASYVLTHLFTGRAAFIHVGAMLGTIMFTNVWFIILRNQAKMITAVNKGSDFNPALATLSARCSKHNTFMAPGLLFMMTSNHAPTLYGMDHNWIAAGALLLLGAGIGQIIRKYC